MKISRAWLQTFFDTPLSDTAALSDALTFHAFEIDGVEKVKNDDVLDVKVTPNRGHDCLSHRGIAKELSAILKIPLNNDPLTKKPDFTAGANSVSVVVEDSKLCPRYIAAHIKDVQVGPSPEWLRTNLEALGQRSINNVVDATNFVMFHLSQPLHAFDAAKLTATGGTYAIAVRSAKAGEKMQALDGKEYTFTDAMLLITDANTDTPIGIAGVKGGRAAEVGSATTDIIIESANFNGVSVRKTAHALKLRTDASARFEQVLSPELAAYGMHAVIELILKLAGGELRSVSDAYPEPQGKTFAVLSSTQAKQILGPSFGEAEIRDVFTRLGFEWKQEKEFFTVTTPFERLDLRIPEDLAEEVGRIIGYKDLPAKELPPFPSLPEVNKHFYAEEQVREELLSQGFSEVYTSVFADSGERMVLNKVDGARAFLRSSLLPGLKDAFAKNVLNRMGDVKLFEIGTMWKGGEERVMVGKVWGTGPESEEALLEVPRKAPKEYQNLPLSPATRYEPFSKYPFVLRDIALWVPKGTTPDAVHAILRMEGGDLLLHSELFDTFEKGDQISLAFHLIFQSFERTLTDEEVSDIMKKVTQAAEEREWRVR